MPKCALCLDREANKKNTHYFTDAIIREALNEPGKKSRGYGAFWEFSTNHLGGKFGFQQETTQDTLSENLGREPDEGEIEKAKENPYTYDDVFCDQCEKHFGTIEDSYLTNVLPKIKKATEDGLEFITVDDIKQIRLFVYLQIWRYSVKADPGFLTPASREQLRVWILEPTKINLKQLSKFPICLSFLSPFEDASRGMIATPVKNESNILLLNQHLIQFFEAPDRVVYKSFYDLIGEKDFYRYLNIKEEAFQVQIIPLNKREESLLKLVGKKADFDIKILQMILSSMWQIYTGKIPSHDIWRKFQKEVLENEHTPLGIKYDKEEISRQMAIFISKETGIKIDMNK